MSKLSELYDFEYGKGNNNPDNGGQYPIYGSNGIIGGYTEYNSVDSPVIGHIGANCGEVVFGKGKHFVTYNGIICKCKEGIDQKFAYYTLLNCKLKDRVRGSAQPFISYDLLNRVNVRIPNLNEQKEIGDILSNIDDLINENKKRIANYYDCANTIYNYWFNQFEFPKNNLPYKSNGGKFKFDDLIKKEIPINWNVEFLPDAMDVLYGYPFDTERFCEKNDGIPVVRIRDILENNTSAFTKEKVDNKYLSRNKDLLIGMDGNFHMNFWYRNGDLINQRITIVRKKKISPLLAYLQIKPFINAREVNVARSTVGHLSDKDIKQLKILIPDDDEINNYFDLILDNICSIQMENEKLNLLRQFLMPILISGHFVLNEIKN